MTTSLTSPAPLAQPNPAANAADLDALAKTVRSEHQLVASAATSMIEHALAAGAALLAAKAALPHGQWLPWLARECPDIKERTAQRYMSLTTGREALAKTNPTRMSDLSLSAAE